MFKKVLLILVLIFALAACTGPAGPASPTGAVSPTVDPAAGGGIALSERVDGLEDFTGRLQALGATVETGDALQQEFFSVPGQRLSVNGADVQVFEYASEAARAVESDLISPDGSSIGTSMVSWVDDPHFWSNNNLIVLYVGSDQAMIDLLNQVMGLEQTK